MGAPPPHSNIPGLVPASSVEMSLGHDGDVGRANIIQPLVSWAAPFSGLCHTGPRYQHHGGVCPIGLFSQILENQLEQCCDRTCQHLPPSPLPCVSGRPLPPRFLLFSLSGRRMSHGPAVTALLFLGPIGYVVPDLDSHLQIIQSIPKQHLRN